MIFQLRLFGLVFELLWVNGLMLGFTLPQGHVRMAGVNLGPFCLCAYVDKSAPKCGFCGRSLRWGLHGKPWGRVVCKPADYKPSARPCGWIE